jgi:hypothetical protein
MASLTPITIECPICPDEVEVPIHQNGTARICTDGDGPPAGVFDLTIDMRPWREHIAAAHTPTRETS